jgi:HSP20 family protein
VTAFTLLYYRPLHGDAPLHRPDEGGWAPPADVYETDEAVVVEMEVPGTAPQALSVVLEDALLIVEGVKAATLPRKASGGVERFLCAERIAGAFRRVLRLPCPVDGARSQARLRDGLLTVTLPRRQSRSATA